MIACVAAIFLSSVIVSFASAISQDQIAVNTIWMSGENGIHPTDNVPVIVTITNTGPNQITITKIGFHFDWQEQGEYYTADLSGSPIVVDPNVPQITEPPITIQIPVFVTAGTHTFTVALQGTEGSSGEVAWGSEDKTINVIALGSTPAPTDLPGSSDNGGQSNSGLSMDTIAIAATVAIVVVVLVIVVLLKRKKPSQKTAPATSEPATAQSEEKPDTASPVPEEKKEAPEEKAPAEDKAEGSDFSI